jgi:hypothetical protein
MSGYLHPAYAASLAELGEPRVLPGSGGTIVVRTLPDGTHRDAMGAYPLFACHDWSRLADDLEAVGPALVSLTVVTDPFGAYDAQTLRSCFPDLARPFKEHAVVDLTREPESFVSAHHRRYARAAAKSVRVDEPGEPATLLDEWTRLYDVLVRRHDIRGPAAFSRSAFAAQLAVPGLVALRARLEEATVAILLWYRQGDVAYYHLGAYSEEGYRSHASFALFWTALKTFRERGVRWLDLGAGAGLGEGAASGLDRFKRGWSTGTRPAYLCGRIFDHRTYEALAGGRAARYFPAYRADETTVRLDSPPNA